MITLTLRHNDEPLHKQIDRLYRCFRRLRMRDFWTAKVKGGAAFLEVGFNERTRRWHPHLHVLVDAAYMPQCELSNQWLSVTGDSSVVDIRKCTEKAHVVEYVLKYVSKPLPTKILDKPILTAECIRALCGRRCALTFGSLRGVRLTTPTQEREFTPIAKLHTILNLADEMHPDALTLVALLSKTASKSSRDPPHTNTNRRKISADELRRLCNGLRDPDAPGVFERDRFAALLQQMYGRNYRL